MCVGCAGTCCWHAGQRRTPHADPGVAMPELTPGTWTRGLARLAEQGPVRAREALESLAETLAGHARGNVSSNGQHAYGTPTPASPGSGPAMISETLKDSIDHSEPIPDALGWSLKVGPRPNQYPEYNSRTPADRYGYYLETGLRNGDTYPWLKPAADAVAAAGTVALMSGVVNRPWPPVF